MQAGVSLVDTCNLSKQGQILSHLLKACSQPIFQDGFYGMQALPPPSPICTPILSRFMFLIIFRACSLCYAFQRATRAVSLAPPACYADLAAERGRCMVSQMISDASTTSSGHKGSIKVRHPTLFGSAFGLKHFSTWGCSRVQ